MRSWMWFSKLSILEPVVGKLFVQFTCQLWMQIDEAWLIDPEHWPEPTSLLDAIKAWSLNEMFKNVQSCGFKACNANIQGSCYDRFFSLYFFSLTCVSLALLLLRTSISTDRLSHADYIVPLTHQFPSHSFLFYDDASL